MSSDKAKTKKKGAGRPKSNSKGKHKYEKKPIVERDKVEFDELSFKQIESMVSTGMGKTAIAQVMDCSTKTVERKIKEHYGFGWLEFKSLMKAKMSSKINSEMFRRAMGDKNTNLKGDNKLLLALWKKNVEETIDEDFDNSIRIGMPQNMDELMAYTDSINSVAKISDSIDADYELVDGDSDA